MSALSSRRVLSYTMVCNLPFSSLRGFFRLQASCKEREQACGKKIQLCRGREQCLHNDGRPDEPILSPLDFFQVDKCEEAPANRRAPQIPDFATQI